jgi:hypothetical protein
MGLKARIKKIEARLSSPERTESCISYDRNDPEALVVFYIKEFGMPPWPQERYAPDYIRSLCERHQITLKEPPPWTEEESLRYGMSFPPTREDCQRVYASIFGVPPRFRDAAEAKLIAEVAARRRVSS